jgi:heme/copper-type cytochrome/quinol oxidase subunit 2
VTTSHGLNEPQVRGGLVGVGAAACAVCCAAPLMAMLGIGLTGAALTAVTIAFASIVFGLVVAVATLAAVLARRRRAERERCEPAVAGPVPVEFGSRPEES